MASESKRWDDLGKLGLRVLFGGLMLLHGVAKVRRGTGGIARMLTEKHLPTFIQYGVYVGEVVVPVLLIAGMFTRPAALVLAFNMVFAIYLAHAGDVFHLSRSGGWAIESAALYLFGALIIAALGPGRFAFARGRRWWS